MRRMGMKSFNLWGVTAGTAPAPVEHRTMGFLPFIPLTLAAAKAYSMWMAHTAAAKANQYHSGMYHDPRTGRDYYYNAQTRQSTWTS